MDVIKRNGQTEVFAVEKIAAAIFRAAEAVGGQDEELAQTLATEVYNKLGDTQQAHVNVIQDMVEKVLIERGHARTAKAYIIYRHKRAQERAQQVLILGGTNTQENLEFTAEALQVLERRYLQGGETPEGLLRRVARSVAAADKHYGSDTQKTTDQFYTLMKDLVFLPNTPTLMNAGTKMQQLNACFVLPIEDRMESIFGTLKNAAIIHQRGGGTGFSFSALRPKGDKVGRNYGVASGPVSFMHVYDTALDVVKQGGVRPGANMAVLRVDHPDILRFIEVKRNKTSLKNFNISVGITDRFMKAVEEDRDYMILHPRLGKFLGKMRARDVFAVITQNAWKTGDPGLIFLDEINRKHPLEQEIETTNQCGEAPLLAYESIALGAIDVAKFVTDDTIDWDNLRLVVHQAVHFLDNMIDVQHYPSKKVEEITKAHRKIGLGVMGFADLLFKLELPYNSQAGRDTADELLGFLRAEAEFASTELAKERGKIFGELRNTTLLALSPTGTRSILAGTSAGIEPVFALCYQRNLMGTQSVALNPVFETIAHARDFYSPELLRKVALRGGIQDLKEIPKDVRDVFITAQDISPSDHILMQSTLQKHVDNAISKTINFPRTAAIKDIEQAYMLAWKMKCKGLTIYRDGSYEDQVIMVGS